jgi:hypothetical protein
MKLMLNSFAHHSMRHTELITTVTNSDVPARLGQKAPTQAWLWGAQALNNVDPGLEPSKAINWGPAQPKAGAQGSGHGFYYICDTSRPHVVGARTGFPCFHHLARVQM